MTSPSPTTTPPTSAPGSTDDVAPLRAYDRASAAEALPRTVWQQVGDVTGGVAAHPFVQVALAAGFVGGASSFVKRQLAKWRARRETIVGEGDDFL